MIVTAMEEYIKGKYKIYLDEQFAFVLYKGELRRFMIKLGQELSESEYEEIINEIILKRSKRRTLHLLEKMDRTEQQIRKKLREGFYPEDIIDKAVEYAKNYHYINDFNYATRYIDCKGSVKSKLEILSELKQKGINKDIVNSIYEEANINEKEVLVSLIKKKLGDNNTPDKNQVRKLMTYFSR